ncbi:MAG: sigma-70 family RNA polymerase sigma factor [Pseudomonadales bacterium]
MTNPLEKAAELLVVGLAQTGDRAAFTELVRRRQSWLRNLMVRLCNDRTLADDLAQQAFLQAWRDIVRLREGRKFAGWLKRIAINVWLKHQRQHDPLRDSAAVEDSNLFSTRTPRPAMAMDLDQALAALNVEQRLCIVLAYHEGMSHREIAELSGLPVGTVKSHIRRGTQQLRARLDSYRDDVAASTGEAYQAVAENKENDVDQQGDADENPV